ncbi:hypothetical protein GCM10010166_19310 [Couchioplanes caeruleus subsp. azureus]|nr:hypothetical protein GCM10010166_19310 [Couchioplanes caeruleus subsp. azureus]
MSNTRRGWLAAGLTAVVAGSLTAGWTPTAYAQEAPGPPAAAADAGQPAPAAADAGQPAPAAADAGQPAPAAADAGEPVPPALLPWGEPPSRLKQAPAGLSSAAVAAAGADAAPAEAGDSREPEPVYAPKGRVPVTDAPAQTTVAQAPPAEAEQANGAAQAEGNLHTETATQAETLAEAEALTWAETVAQAARIARAETVAGSRTVRTGATTARGATANPAERGNRGDRAGKFYHYAAGSQIGATDGTSANLHIAKPELATADAHTLTEIAVQSADSKQIVEVGWTVDRKVNGDDDPHLFVFHWKDGKPTCYNACGFEVYSQATIKPGATLPTGVQKRFGIQRSGAAWWIAYDSEWVGYFPDKLWNGTFTRAGATQWFGEVASATERTCTDMGKGLPPTDGTASRIGTIQMVNGPDPNASVRSTNPDYGVLSLSPSTFRYGGPGNGAC